jgi:hypothetical protein
MVLLDRHVAKDSDKPIRALIVKGLNPGDVAHGRHRNERSGTTQDHNDDLGYTQEALFEAGVPTRSSLPFRSEY